MSLCNKEVVIILIRLYGIVIAYSPPYNRVIHYDYDTVLLNYIVTQVCFCSHKEPLLSCLRGVSGCSNYRVGLFLLKLQYLTHKS